MFKKKLHIKYGKHSIILETGYIAKQTDSSILANMEDTIVLVTVVIDNQKKVISPVLCLSVNYQEKSYAAGKIPNSYLRREGRPTENEILKSRLIDRSIRPLFKNFFYEIQINLTVLSINPLIDPIIVSIIATSAALSISNLPFYGPIGVAQIGYIQNKFILNPSIEELNYSKLNLLVCSTKKSIIMVDAEAKLISEDILFKAIVYGHKKQQIIINNINNFIINKNKKNFYKNDLILINKKIKYLYPIIKKLTINKFKKVFCIINKKERVNKIKLIINKLYYNLNKLNIIYEQNIISYLIYKISKYIVRKNILYKNKRIDNRNNNNIRPININLNILPRSHGSVLFSRGETQALVITTLATTKQAQIIDEIYGEKINNIIFHYNFPSYAVGEIGNINTPKRREIGHGCLARKGLLPILPSIKNFPYTIRIVSEITECNGSSSMASVCGASLSLMLAGVPINNHVAGISMGLIKKNEKYIILSDILGDEDNFGDLDFKLIGNELGITALQMDIKIDYINFNILKQILFKAKKGIINILNKMKDKISKPKIYISKFAPKIKILNINPLQIKNLIGKGGIIIKSITEDTETNIEIENNGIITIYGLKKEQINIALRKIKIIICNLNIGDIYLATIKKIKKLFLYLSFDEENNFYHKAKFAINKNIYKKLKVKTQIFIKIINIDDLGFIYIILNK